MKLVYKCDYCSKMGTEAMIKEHEPKCPDNYDKRSCYTCKHKSIVCSHNKTTHTTEYIYECKIGKVIPKEHVVEFCDAYDRREKIDWFANLFNDYFV